MFLIWKKLHFTSRSLKANNVCLCVFIGCTGFYPSFSITGKYRFPAGLDCIHNMLLLWSLDTFCLLLSGWGDPQSPPSLPPHPSPLSSSTSPYYPLFSLAWDIGRMMTEVSAQVMVILSCHSVPTGPGVDAFLPVLCLHQSALCVLRVHIPAHQELLLSSLTGVWLHWAIVEGKPVWMFLSLILHLFF